ncbi:6,7-dimethyl-8-ribityllumazine synthase [Legionella sp. WA2022007384]
MPKILIISSGVHKDLAAEQLELCVTLVKNAGYDYQVELLQAGAYEIPFVINTYHQKNPFDGYIALGLILKINLDHYDNIMSHIRYCFTQFALNDIVVGNGIITGSTIEELSENVRSANPCHSAYPSAFNAVDCLIKLKNKIAPTAS